jgi:hypothetical protein
MIPGGAIELVELSREEINLLKFIRGLDFGSLDITVQFGKPVMVKQAIKSVKL